jgi:hypothetical protein
MAAKRSIMRIETDSVAAGRLDSICERRGMTQISCMSRLVNWFSDQDDYTQIEILHLHTPASVTPLAKRLLQRLSQDNNRASDSRSKSKTTS